MCGITGIAPADPAQALSAETMRTAADIDPQRIRRAFLDQRGKGNASSGKLRQQGSIAGRIGIGDLQRGV